MKTSFSSLLFVAAAATVTTQVSAVQRSRQLHQQKAAVTLSKSATAAVWKPGRYLTTCNDAPEYYDCTKSNKQPAFGSCDAAEACIEAEGVDSAAASRALRALKGQGQGGGASGGTKTVAACWPSNPNCCDFGYEYGLKIESCTSTSGTYCLKDGIDGSARGTVDIVCPTSKHVEWAGDIMFEAAFRKNADRMYKDENDLVCGADADAGQSSGSIQGTHHATSHFDLCWNADSPYDPSFNPAGAMGGGDDPSDFDFDPAPGGVDGPWNRNCLEDY